MAAMAESVKAFLTIASLLVGAFLVHDGMWDYHHSKQEQMLIGTLLVAAGLTALWIRFFGSKKSN